MQQFTTNLYTSLEKGLQEVSITNNQDMEKAKAGFYVTQQTMQQLKEFILCYQFPRQEDEIDFFKNIKPRFHKHLLYYSELVYIQAELPVADRKNQVDYYKGHIASNLNIMSRHKALHSYIKLGNDHADEQLFLRDNNTDPLYPEYSGDLDNSFCTLSSSYLAKLLGLEKVNSYLSHQIDQIKRKDKSLPPAITKSGGLVWTDSKADLVELAYALHAKGSINYGKATIKDIIDTLENILSVNTGNFYRTYTDLTNRKKSWTPYLDGLKEFLERKMKSNL